MKSHKTDAQKEVVFLRLGGTWDQLLKNDGQLFGKGGIEEGTLAALEEKLGIYEDNVDIDALEEKLSEQLDKLISQKNKVRSNIIEALSFVPEIKNLVKGEYINLYSGDSSQFRTGFISALIPYVFNLAWKNREKTIIIAPGTDLLDVALMPIFDVLSFDSNLFPFLFTSSNKGWRYANSDAPQNFYDTMRVTHIDIPAGAYWIFAGRFFNGSDLVKISPMRKRMVDNFSSFYSPHLKAADVEEVIRWPKRTNGKNKKQQNHLSISLTREKLFKAIKQVHVVDLGLQNEIREDIEAITNPKYKAVIIAANSLGNVDNAVKYASIKAAKNNKLVIVVSRCLIGEVHLLDFTYLPQVNTHELRGTGKVILSGYKLNKNVARALALRAILEDYNQYQTQELIDRYTAIRGLSPQDTIIV